MINYSGAKQKGFTIVELLIVIVVIAILAAITIVAYNGITNNANASAGLAAASSSAKKASSYHAVTGSHPTAPSQLTGAGAASTSYYLTGVTFAAATTSITPASTLVFISCPGAIGVKIGYYDNTNSVVVYLYTGTATAANCTSTTGLTT